MTDKPAGGLPDYFALFQSLLKPAAAKGMESVGALFDAKELEKKIGELEIVIAWLQGTTKVLETSVEAMRLQKQFLDGVASATTRRGAKPDDSAPAKGVSPADLSRIAEAMNPAAWAMNLMDKAAAPAPRKKRTTRKPR